MRKLTLQPDRTRWHLIFPLGFREQIVRPDGSTREQEFSRAWCQRLVDSLAEFAVYSASAGMPPQMPGLTIEHSIAYALQGEDVEPARAGQVVGLHLHEGDGFPPGVYALIESACHGPDPMHPFLSPTTSESGWTVSTGQRIQGPFLVEVALVAQPKLETIGYFEDGLHWTAFPTPAWVETPAQQDAADFAVAAETLRSRVAAADTLITRSARSIDPPQEALTMTPEQFKELLHESLQDMLVAIEAKLDGLDARMKAYEERAASPPEAASEPAPEPAPAPASEPDPTDDLEARALRAFRADVAKEFEGLIAERRILPHRAGDFVARRLEGKDVVDLLGDYRHIGEPTGQPGAPPQDGAAKPSKVTADELEARAKREHPHDIRARAVRFNELTADARKAGTLEEG